MFEMIQKLWADRVSNGMTEAFLDLAVSRDWIKPEQKEEIMNGQN